MGSTDPEVSRHLHPCTNLGMQNALAHNSGRSAPGWCPFWAFNAHLLPFLALNARTMLVLGVQRQNAAHFGRSAPEPCSVLALNARQVLPPGCDFSSAVFDFVSKFFVYFVTPHDHEPKKT